MYNTSKHNISIHQFIVKNKKYLPLVIKFIKKAINQFKPNLIIFNAGTDIYKNDQLGNFNISANGIIQRDTIVFSLAQKYNIPILMVLSGGYSKQSGLIIGKSVVNIITNVIKK